MGGAAVLVVLVWRLGTVPFLSGVRTISVWSIAAAAGIAVLTTVCCAWRWSIVARGLGVRVPLRTAIAAYYRSQFLNTTLPGGMLGDVHRGVRHGRDVGDLGRGLRAVAWERSAGQVIQIVVAVVVLLILPSPVQMLPLAMIVLLAMGVPTNIAGWGPREGVAAWAFGAAGASGSEIHADPIRRPDHGRPPVRAMPTGPLRAERAIQIRRRAPATAEPKGATRG
jgi:uncharacterized membrane protein YbhN (UPF0104 family)